MEQVGDFSLALLFSELDDQILKWICIANGAQPRHELMEDAFLKDG